MNGKIQVHMGPHGIPDSERYYLGTTAKSATDSSGVVDHIAFLASDPEAFRKRFDRSASRRATATFRSSSCTRPSSRTRTAS